MTWASLCLGWTWGPGGSGSSFPGHHEGSSTAGGCLWRLECHGQCVTRGAREGEHLSWACWALLWMQGQERWSPCDWAGVPTAAVVPSASLMAAPACAAGHIQPHGHRALFREAAGVPGGAHREVGCGRPQLWGMGYTGGSDLLSATTRPSVGLSCPVTLISLKLESIMKTGVWP